MTAETFDLARDTSLKGTVSRVGQFVRGDCACGAANELVYDHPDNDTLICANCYRHVVHGRKRREICDECGTSDAWRDPVTRKNEFFCANCHGKHGTVFQNRWRGSDPVVIGMHRAECAAAGYGTDCKGEIKWRGAHGKSLCNKHAGVTSNGPEWHS